MGHTIDKSFIEWLEKNPPKSADIIYRDEQQPGFGIRATPRRISYFVQRKMGRSESVKRTLGSHPSLTLPNARKKAQIWLGWMAEGLDPALVIRQRRIETEAANSELRRTFGKVFADYVVMKGDGDGEGSAPSTIKDREKVPKKLGKTKLWHSPFSDITVDVVDRDLAPIFKISAANGWRLYRYCRAAYQFEADKLNVAGNPFSLWRKWRKPKLVARRETILPTAQIEGQLWLKELVRLRDDENFPVNVTADYLLCLLLWGGRKTETQRLKPQDVDFENKFVIFRGGNTKNKLDHYLPLTPWAAEILKARLEKNIGYGDEWVFPSRLSKKHLVEIRNVLEILHKASGLKIGAHDLRRTFATELLGDSGANLFLVKAAMNHAAIGHDVTVGYISVKARVDALRPSFEVRERRLMQLAGVLQAAEAVPDELMKAVLSAAKNPKLRKELQNALKSGA